MGVKVLSTLVTFSRLAWGKQYTVMGIWRVWGINFPELSMMSMMSSRSGGGGFQGALSLVKVCMVMLDRLGVLGGGLGLELSGLSGDFLLEEMKLRASFSCKGRRDSLCVDVDEGL